LWELFHENRAKRALKKAVARDQPVARAQPVAIVKNTTNRVIKKQKKQTNGHKTEFSLYYKVVDQLLLPIGEYAKKRRDLQLAWALFFTDYAVMDHLKYLTFDDVYTLRFDGTDTIEYKGKDGKLEHGEKITMNRYDTPERLKGYQY
jgi:hypothetical protein